MVVDKIKLSKVKGRNQIVITFHNGLLKGSGFEENEYAVIVIVKNRITIVKEGQLEAGVDQLKVGTDQIEAGVDQLKVSTDQLKVGTDQLKVGA